MKIGLFLFNLIAALLLVFVFSKKHTIGDVGIPAVAKILNPFSGVWQNADDHKYEDLVISDPTLSQPVEVVFDKRLVPHIYAQNLQDLLFAQGYVEAYLRLWQMDISYRSAEGSLSEVVGSKALKNDIWMRKLGLNHAAKKSVAAWKKMDNYDEKVVSAFERGINKYITELDRKDIPVEFKLIDYLPSEWNMYKSALIQKSMGNVLASNANDVAYTNAKLYFGEETFDYLYPEFDDEQLPIIANSDHIGRKSKKREKPEGIDYNGPLLTGLEVIRPKKGLGSNNWAVGPAKTKSGAAMLANDPHLNLTLPSIWNEVHLSCPEFNAYGVSIAGIPGIVIGFNENISWGLTNVGHDVKDYYAIDWKNEEKTKYALDGEIAEVEERKETIKIRGAADQEINIKETYFGPVYYESTNDSVPDLAMDWLVTRTPTSAELNAFLDIMKSRNYEEFKLATAQFEVPAQNFLFADQKGNIALRVNGKLPLKYEGEGRFVKNGNARINKWDQFIDRTENPQTENPAEAYVGSANQVSAGAEYPYYFNGGFEDFRGKRVYQELDRREQMTVQDMKELQADEHSLKAEKVLPFFLKAIATTKWSSYQKSLIQKLEKWDYSYNKDLEAPSIFNTWYTDFADLYWDELETDFKMYRPENWRFLEMILEEKNSPFADIKATSEIESNTDLILMSFKSASEKLASKKDQMKWKDYRPTRIGHLANIPGFGTGKLDVGGHGDVLNAMNRGGFGPSWRMIIDYSNGRTAEGVFPGGQSGNPGSRFYRSSLDKWVNMEYNTLNLYKTKNEMGNNVLYSLKLSPDEK